MSRAFSAGFEAVNSPGALPQAGNEAAPLAPDEIHLLRTSRPEGTPILDVSGASASQLCQPQCSSGEKYAHRNIKDSHLRAYT
jgi:hypothetical protein